MPAYRYEAIDLTGTLSKGVINADNPRSARSDLRARGLVPMVMDVIVGQAAVSGHRL